MRGAPLKLAQMLSIQEQNLIPAPIRKAFQKARDKAHIMLDTQVDQMLARNLGPNWNQSFKSFNNKPFAAASIGQVHKATSIDGMPLAVKVQYPGVKFSIRSDVSNLRLLFKLPKVLPKGLYIDAILDKTEAQLLKECDYIEEKTLQNRYTKILSQSFGNQAHHYRIPKVIQSLTTGQILTSQYLSGLSMKEIEEGHYPQQLRDKIGYRIMALTFKELFDMGIVQSDPNPANYAFNNHTDQLILYDFGATHCYKKQFLENYFAIIRGAMNMDREEIIRASIATGFLTGEESKVMIDSHVESIQIVGEPLRYKGSFDFGAQSITQRIYKTIPLMLKYRLKAPPQEVYSLHRKLSGSYLACMRLRARVNCHSLLQNLQFRSLIHSSLIQT